MKILHVVASIHASTGGPALSVTRLASEQARLGHEVTLASLEYPHLGPQLKAEGVKSVSVKGGPLAVGGRGWSPRFKSALAAAAATADVVHNHGLWMWPNAYARMAAEGARKPLVISPRGMLEAWSLRRSPLRKSVAWRLFERRNLQSASLFHATAAHEAESIRDTVAGLRGEARETVPLVIAPNGVDLPDAGCAPEREFLEVKFPMLRGRRWIAFVSRLHPKKGIDVLLRAFAHYKRLKHAGIRDPLLVLAGPDLTGYRKEVARMIRQWDLEDSVVITGEVRGELKDALFANAAVCALPSYSENFGMVVAEAMAWGCPVIASTATPWKEVEECGAGWWVAPEEGAVAEALEQALGKSDAELDAMGASGRRLVADHYSWRVPASKLVDAYGSLPSLRQCG